DLSKLVLHKLTAIIESLDYKTHKKSIAIYVSPVFEKVLYLDIAVEEKIIIDESFEIRDLLYSKKQLHKYLVLLLSGKESRLYLASSKTFIRITSGTEELVEAYQNDIPEKVANFTNSSDQKQILVNKFLHSIDESLNKILQVYQLPLFVLGTEKILGQFKKITKHEAAVVEYVHGNYEDLSLVQLDEILKPAVAGWIIRTQKNLLKQLEDAAGENKLAIGMRDVWKHAMNQRGRLLLVEQNYMYAAVRGSHEKNIYKFQEPYNKFSLIKDAVDDVIEAVLQNGGDVEFVDSELLKPYHHIALILYY
ncbi:MAG TPA: hypothetical protein VLR49_07000, partial [Ferruginibacter sp.]|nr:hypothetical protein [Ferruginibacter sp.]